MYWFILLIMSPLIMAETPPNCVELSNILQHYETEIMSKNMGELQINGEKKKCSQVETKDLFKDNENQTLMATVDEYKCRPLSAIEERLRNLQNQESLLRGFEKLKVDILTNKKQTGSSNQNFAKRSALNFVDSLRTAKSLELLLATKDKDQKDIIKALKQIPPSELSTVPKFKEKLSELCKGRKIKKGEMDACHPTFFDPNEESLAAINELLAHNGSDKTLQSWREAMQIQKRSNGQSYSFSQMHEDLKEKLPEIDQGNLVLSRDDLAAIRALPDFQNAKGIKFLNAKKKLDGTTQAYLDYKFLVGDLQLRQEHEVQSKLTQVFAEYSLNKEDIAACAQVKAQFQNAATCIDQLKTVQDKLEGMKKADLTNLLKSVDVSMNYHGFLKEIDGKCLQKAGPISVECEIDKGLGNLLNNDLGQIQNEILALNAIKEKIGSQNMDTMKIRNFALGKLSQKSDCLSLQNSDVSCSGDFDNKISDKAIYLASNVLDLALVYHNPESKPQIDELCSDEEKKFYKKDKLCAVPSDKKEAAVIKPRRNKKDEYQPSTKAPFEAHDGSNDPWLNGLSTLASDLAAQLQPKPRPLFAPNPYMYNYGPYQSFGPMGISDSILFNARYYGAYGYYMPTRGLQPYTAFPVPPVSGYSSLGQNTSPYFYSR